MNTLWQLTTKRLPRTSLGLVKSLNSKSENPNPELIEPQGFVGVAINNSSAILSKAVPMRRRYSLVLSLGKTTADSCSALKASPRYVSIHPHALTVALMILYLDKAKGQRVQMR